jgi:cation transport protein ChaC
VAAANWDMIFAYLQAREQDRGVYRETWRRIHLASGEVVSALAYLVNEDHPQYAGRLELDRQVELIAGSAGEAGRNTEYVRNTARHLMALGIHDRALEAIVGALDRNEVLLAPSP